MGYTEHHTNLELFIRILNETVTPLQRRIPYRNSPIFRLYIYKKYIGLTKKHVGDITVWDTISKMFRQHLLSLTPTSFTAPLWFVFKIESQQFKVTQIIIFGEVTIHIKRKKNCTKISTQHSLSYKIIWTDFKLFFNIDTQQQQQQYLIRGHYIYQYVHYCSLPFVIMIICMLRLFPQLNMYHVT